MSAIQELAPYIAKYQPSIKRAKMEKGYTCNDLVELSGISKSAVERLCDGRKLIRNCLMPLLSVKCLGYPSTNSSVYHLL